MAYRHIDLVSSQSAKNGGALCGDVVECCREWNATTAVLCDGMGSGPRAHLAAQWYTTRFMRLLAGRLSLRQAFDTLCQTLAASRGSDPVWAAITVIRIRQDGEVTILSHEMPEAILVSGRHASVLPRHTSTRKGCLVDESLCHLRPGEGIVFFSDGVSQAGMRQTHGKGWQGPEIAAWITESLRAGLDLPEVPASLHMDARRRWDKDDGDDISAALLMCREGLVVNILTGPPANAKNDREVVRNFMQSEGMKVTCGCTTASLVARHTGKKLVLNNDLGNSLIPPSYKIEGLDMATEGTVTLSQVSRIIDAEPDLCNDPNPVSQLAGLLQAADAVCLTVGLAANEADHDIIYRQIGVLNRRDIVTVLKEKLEKMGKLVDIKWV